MRQLLEADPPQELIELDSAGTGGWHVGHPPDPRSVAAAAVRGIVVNGQARTVTSDDFERFDLIIAMDRQNLAALRERAPDAQSAARLRLLREFDPSAVASGELDVPDPYYGGERGFEDVLDLLTAACRGLLAEIRVTEVG
jgi:protein-tyrosine phosphatase